MKSCTGCGAPNMDAARFCSACGSSFDIMPSEPPAVSGSRENSAEVSQERITAVVFSYIAAYLFMTGFGARYRWEAVIILTLVVAAVELVNKGRPRAAESWVWLGCFAANACSYCFGLDKVWECYDTGFFAVVFGVWWVLSRSGKLLEGKSGHLLPADAWTGFAVLPFTNYLLRFRTITAGIRSRRRDGNAGRAGRGWWTAAAAVVCVLLFLQATKLLMKADTGFSVSLNRLYRRLKLDFDTVFIGECARNIVLSIPLGCLGCGLILSGASVDRSSLDHRRDRLCIRLTALHRVPEWLWIAVIGLFSVLYVSFFVFQGSYLFGAFAGKLPEGFIVSEYARQGFFELCKVMVVNSVVMWLATRMVSAEMRHEKCFKAACIVLLSESILFSVIAFSKLVLYMSVYGFTCLRLQSTWLVCVLFAACVLWIYTIVTGRKVFRAWMMFGAVTLSILALL